MGRDDPLLTAPWRDARSPKNQRRDSRSHRLPLSPGHVGEGSRTELQVPGQRPHLPAQQPRPKPALLLCQLYSGFSRPVTRCLSLRSCWPVLSVSLHSVPLKLFVPFHLCPVGSVTPFLLRPNPFVPETPFLHLSPLLGLGMCLHTCTSAPPLDPSHPTPG